MTHGQGKPQDQAALGDLTRDAQATEHLRRAAEHAPIGIICVSGATGRYVFANAAFARMIGRSHEDVLNADPFQISMEATHPDDRALGRDAMERIAKGEMDTYHYEKRLVRADGEVFWASVDMLATRDAEGRLAYLTQYFIDVNARHSADAARSQLEGELLHAQKLEALGRFAGGVAHDFNNRLAVIMAYAELIRDRLPVDAPFAHYAQEVLDSAQRASELTRQLLAYSRRQVLELQVLDLNSVVERMRALLARLIGDDIELVTTLQATLPISADPGQLERVIINLAVNARDAMPRGGRLELATGDVVLAPGDDPTLPAGDYLELVVRDSGAGIPEEVLPRIFEPFFTTKEVGRGTGLGLATVEGIVRQSGGRVRVQSHVGRGTVFSILLPRGHEQPLQAPPRSIAPLTSGRSLETVLVCEDDQAVLEVIVNVLGLRGYHMLQAGEGDEALQVAEQHSAPIHMLVTDLVMPGLQGTELAARLRRKHPQLRVLYVSGYTDDPSVLSGVREPGTSFLSKPFLPSELTQVVCSMLERPTTA
jgi:two-component system, cell cycle sensor histidine kinase and response regulator CckA